MGSSVKFQLQFERRLWNDLGCNGEIRRGRPPPSRRAGTRPAAKRASQGVFNFWSGGSQAAFDASDARIARALARLCLAGADEILPGLAAAVERALDARRLEPQPLVSRAPIPPYPPGYQTTLLGIEQAFRRATSIFAGEHTWSQVVRLSQCSAVASGIRAANQVQAVAGGLKRSLIPAFAAMSGTGVRPSHHVLEVRDRGLGHRRSTGPVADLLAETFEQGAAERLHASPCRSPSAISRSARPIRPGVEVPPPSASSSAAAAAAAMRPPGRPIDHGRGARLGRHVLLHEVEDDADRPCGPWRARGRWLGADVIDRDPAWNLGFLRAV